MQGYRATCACGHVLDASSQQELMALADAHIESVDEAVAAAEEGEGGDDAPPSAEQQAACRARCGAWARLPRDALGGAACEDKPKALAGLIAAGVAGAPRHPPFFFALFVTRCRGAAARSWTLADSMRPPSMRPPLWRRIRLQNGSARMTNLYVCACTPVAVRRRRVL